MLQIFLYDSNQRDIIQYGRSILACADKHRQKIELCCFTQIEELLCEICDFGRHADIIYLDVCGDKTNGIEAARRLREAGVYAQIVFLSDSMDYVHQAFEVEALQYLVKGQTNDDYFEQVFCRAVSRIVRLNEELFVCEFGGVQASVPIHQIAYFDIMNRVITIHSDDQHVPVKFYGSMDLLEKRLLAHQFLRIHRSFLVHLPYIAKFSARKLTLKSGRELPVGGIYLKTAKNIFLNYVSKNSIFCSWDEEKPEYGQASGR